MAIYDVDLMWFANMERIWRTESTNHIVFSHFCNQIRKSNVYVEQQLEEFA